MKAFVFSLLLFTGALNAQTKKPAKAYAAPVTIWTAGDPDYAKRFVAPGANIQVLSNEYDDERNRRAGYIEGEPRDAIFRKVGIETKISSFDQVDRDMLVVCAWTYNARELLAEYPMLTKTEAQRLIAEVRKHK